jgi:TM2 domain-containing membrane protein YozV
MSDAWKRIDLGGGGLQEANLRLARQLRRRRTAYLLWLGFPLGLHRWYLKDRAGALAYCALSLGTLFVAPLAAAALLFALSDLWWIDQRVTRLNKALRMQAYLRPGAEGPTKSYTERFGRQ